jgi:hypothetical protein
MKISLVNETDLSMEQNTTDEEKRLANPKYGYIKKNKPRKDKPVVVEERTKPEILNNKPNPVYFATLSTGLGGYLVAIYSHVLIVVL